MTSSTSNDPSIKSGGTTLIRESPAVRRAAIRRQRELISAPTISPREKRRLMAASSSPVEQQKERIRCAAGPGVRARQSTRDSDPRPVADWSDAPRPQDGAPLRRPRQSANIDEFHRRSAALSGRLDARSDQRRNADPSSAVEF